MGIFQSRRANRSQIEPSRSVEHLPVADNTNEDRFNYLVVLPVTVLETLVKMMDYNDEKSFRQAFTLSQVDRCGERSPAPSYFLSSYWLRVIWHCALFTAEFRPRRGIQVSYSRLLGKDKHALWFCSSKLKHLTLVVQSFYIERETCDFILGIYLVKPISLQTMTIVVNASIREAELSSADINVFRRGLIKAPTSVTQLMLEMKAKGVSVYLEVNILSDLYLDLRALSNFPLSTRPYLISNRMVFTPPFKTGLVKMVPVRLRHTHPKENSLVYFVDTCPFLQHLQLYISNFSDDLLYALARRVERIPSAPMQTLTIFKCGIPAGGIPDLSSEAWSTLIKVSPCLQVSCDIRGADHNILLQILKPNVPLVNLTIEETSVELQNNIIDTCENFSRTLQFFKCHTRIDSPIGRLEDLVTDGYQMSTRRSFRSGSDLTIMIC